MLGGAAGCLFSFLATGVYGNYASLALPVMLGTLAVYLLSGALLGGCLSKALADSLVKTGVLNNFAIAQNAAGWVSKALVDSPVKIGMLNNFTIARARLKEIQEIKAWIKRWYR